MLTRPALAFAGFLCLLTLGACTALRGGMSQEEMRSVIDERIRIGDSPERVRAAFIDLARPELNPQLKLEPVERGQWYDGTPAAFVMIGEVNQQFGLPFHTMGATVYFLFDASPRLVTYRWLRNGAAL